MEEAQGGLHWRHCLLRDKCDKMVCEFCYTHAQSMIEKKKKEAKRRPR